MGRVKGRELGQIGRAVEEDKGQSMTGGWSDNEGGNAASLVTHSADTVGRPLHRRFI